MLKLLLNYIHEYCDAPRPWGLYFQDSAAPQMEGLVELHDNIMFYLIIILFGVGWIITSVIRNYAMSRSPISHKYLNHGIDVPVHNNSNSISPLPTFSPQRTSPPPSPISICKYVREGRGKRRLGAAPTPPLPPPRMGGGEKEKRSYLFFFFFFFQKK